jgi:hypothetical protein
MKATRIAAILLIAMLTAGFLGYTGAGARLLGAIGLATACDGGCS